MINFYDQVPSVYNNASRDFQFLSWLINIVLNSVKHNVDDLYDLPNTKADPKLTELLAMTLGFKVKRNYDKKQLTVLVSILPIILKYKGSERAVELAGKALVKASGASGSVKTELKDCCLEVLLPEGLVDTTLFMDLLPYILPAGLTCRVVRNTEIPKNYKTDVGFEETLNANWFADISWNAGAQLSYGPAQLYDVDNKVMEFANYDKPLEKDDNGLPINLNTGLLDNSIIPVLDTPLYNSDLYTTPAPIDTEEGDNSL